MSWDKCKHVTGTFVTHPPPGPNEWSSPKMNHVGTQENPSMIKIHLWFSLLLLPKAVEKNSYHHKDLKSIAHRDYVCLFACLFIYTFFFQ